jgi:hypothetical protein
VGKQRVVKSRRSKVWVVQVSVPFEYIFGG